MVTITMITSTITHMIIITTMGTSTRRRSPTTRCIVLPDPRRRAEGTADRERRRHRRRGARGDRAARFHHARQRREGRRARVGRSRLSRAADEGRERGHGGTRIPMHTTHLVALENTDSVHNVVVCTLCSCYPRELLGLPPSWYKSKAYRARIVREPRAVLEEFGTKVPENVELRVRDSTADLRYLVVPKRPEGTGGHERGATCRPRQPRRHDRRGARQASGVLRPCLRARLTGRKPLLFQHGSCWAE